MNITRALNEQSHFSISEIEIANYILCKKEKVLSMSVQDIAKETYTSTSAVVRLCRKISLSGFKEFKIKYSAELQQKVDQINHVDSSFPFNKTDSLREIASKMAYMAKDTVNETLNLLNDSDMLIEKATDCILNAEKVGIFCIGDSYIRALGFQSKMAKINKTILLTSVPGEQIGLAYFLNKNDCAIIISYSGNTPEVLTTVKCLKSHRVPIITITSNSESKIGRLSSIILKIPQTEGNFRFGTFSSQLSIEYYLNTLYSYFFVLDYENNKKRKMGIDEYG